MPHAQAEADVRAPEQPGLTDRELHGKGLAHERVAYLRRPWVAPRSTRGLPSSWTEKREEDYVYSS